MNGVFLNSGPGMLAGTRIFVQHDMYEQLRDQLEGERAA